MAFDKFDLDTLEDAIRQLAASERVKTRFVKPSRPRVAQAARQKKRSPRSPRLRAGCVIFAHGGVGDSIPQRADKAGGRGQTRQRTESHAAATEAAPTAAGESETTKIQSREAMINEDKFDKFVSALRALCEVNR